MTASLPSVLPPSPPLVKICGVRTLAGAQAAVDAGADLISFIFYPPARRYVAPDHVAALLRQLRGRSRVLAAGVFVNPTLEMVREVAARCGLDAVQLAGDELPDFVAALGQPVLKVFRPSDDGSFALCAPEWYAARARCEGPAPEVAPTHEQSRPSPTLRGESYGFPNRRLLGSSPRRRASLVHRRGFSRRPTCAPTGLIAALLEPPRAGWGGAGVALDWPLARAVTAQPDRPPVFLAGGLHPGNVAEAIRAVGPDGVDVSSGVERDGAQDPERIAAFVAAAKGAWR